MEVPPDEVRPEDRAPYPGRCHAVPLGVANAGKACLAENDTQGTPSTHDLQATIDAASPGDVIRIRGTCGGPKIEIAEDLTLVGEPNQVASRRRSTARGPKESFTSKVSASHWSSRTSGSPAATLRVKVAGFEAMRRSADPRALRRRWECGAVGWRWDLQHRVGDTEELQGRGQRGERERRRRNRSFLADLDGQFIRLRGTTSVDGNTASGTGGGIYSPGSAPISMHGQASVVNNSGHSGGGIHSNGLVKMNDDSRVANNSGDNGGGVNANLMIMNHRASVEYNVGRIGAGVSARGDRDERRVPHPGQSRCAGWWGDPVDCRGGDRHERPIFRSGESRWLGRRRDL